MNDFKSSEEDFEKTLFHKMQLCNDKEGIKMLDFV